MCKYTNVAWINGLVFIKLGMQLIIVISNLTFAGEKSSTYFKQISQSSKGMPMAEDSFFRRNA
jgi:hypothetical protein